MFEADGDHLAGAVSPRGPWLGSPMRCGRAGCRLPPLDEAAVIAATLEPPPERLSVTHWSTRLLATELEISNVVVGKIWARGYDR